MWRKPVASHWNYLLLAITFRYYFVICVRAYHDYDIMNTLRRNYLFLFLFFFAQLHFELFKAGIKRSDLCWRNKILIRVEWTALFIARCRLQVEVQKPARMNENWTANLSRITTWNKNSHQHLANSVKIYWTPSFARKIELLLPFRLSLLKNMQI